MILLWGLGVLALILALHGAQSLLPSSTTAASTSPAFGPSVPTLELEDGNTIVVDTGFMRTTRYRFPLDSQAPIVECMYPCLEKGIAETFGADAEESAALFAESPWTHREMQQRMQRIQDRCFGTECAEARRRSEEARAAEPPPVHDH